jgi:hypothetical protein
LVLVYAALFYVVPALAQDECMQGKMDGERDAKGNPLWFLAGLGCGIFGAGAAYIYNPDPPAQGLMGKSSEYVLCYTDAYKKKAKMKNTTYACVGWAVWIAIVVATGGFETD